MMKGARKNASKSKRKSRIALLSILVALTILSVLSIISCRMVGLQSTQSRFREQISHEAVETKTSSNQQASQARESDPSYDKYLKTQISKLDDPVHHSNIARDDKNKIEPELYTRFSKYQRDGIIDFVGKRAICVGARLGAEVRAMRRIGALAVGVDLNPGLNNPHVLLGDAHSIGFASGSADLLYSNVLDHILDVDGFIEQVADQLAGGALFLMDLSKKAPDKYATNDFRKKKGDVMESLRKDFVVVHELDESKPEEVWFIVARRKVRSDGKSSGSVPAVLVVGDPIANVRSKALALKAEGVFVIAMSPGASKDKTVLTCSQDLQSGKAQLRTEQIGGGAAACY